MANHVSNINAKVTANIGEYVAGMDKVAAKARATAKAAQIDVKLPPVQADRGERILQSERLNNDRKRAFSLDALAVGGVKATLALQGMRAAFNVAGAAAAAASGDFEKVKTELGQIPILGSLIRDAWDFFDDISGVTFYREMARAAEESAKAQIKSFESIRGVLRGVQADRDAANEGLREASLGPESKFRERQLEQLRFERDLRASRQKEEEDVNRVRAAGGVNVDVSVQRVRALREEERLLLTLAKHERDRNKLIEEGVAERKKAEERRLDNARLREQARDDQNRALERDMERKIRNRFREQRFDVTTRDVPGALEQPRARTLLGGRIDTLPVGVEAIQVKIQKATEKSAEELFRIRQAISVGVVAGGFG